MAKGVWGRAGAALKRDLGNEFAFALDDIRHKVVEQPMFGRATTPEAVDFYRWLGDEPQPPGAEAGSDRDPMGRTSEPEQPEAEPMEGRPGNLEEREAIATAYARHKEAGPFGLMEMENALADDWREFEEWLDGRGDGWGPGEGEEHELYGPDRDDERELEGPEID